MDTNPEVLIPRDTMRNLRFELTFSGETIEDIHVSGISTCVYPRAQ
jgi:hypothetical protein